MVVCYGCHQCTVFGVLTFRPGKSSIILLIQLFRERLSVKVHATILKGIVGGFEFSVFQRNLKELARKAMEMCLRVLKESNKSRFDSYSVRNSVLIISHITFRDCRVHIFPTTFVEIAVCYQNQTPNELFNFFHVLKPLMILLNSGRTFRSHANSREPWHARENVQAIS